MNPKLTLLFSLAALSLAASEQSLTLKEVSVSRHMVLPDKASGTYYMSGTTDLKNVWEGPTDGFHVYSSPDLENWSKHHAWKPPEGSEWKQQAWGAVIVPWNGKFVLLGSALSSERNHHGILSMISDTPEGPYTLRSPEPLMEGKATHETIDPTHVLDADGSPWLVTGGEKGIFAAPLSEDLLRITNAPVRLLHNSEVPGAILDQHDAPAFHRLKNGELLMFYSAKYDYREGIDPPDRRKRRLATFKLRSTSGKVTGPWVSEGIFLPRRHGIWIWRRFDGQLMFTAKPDQVSIEKGYPGFTPLHETDNDVILPVN